MFELEQRIGGPSRQLLDGGGDRLEVISIVVVGEVRDRIEGAPAGERLAGDEREDHGSGREEREHERVDRHDSSIAYRDGPPPPRPSYPTQGNVDTPILASRPSPFRGSPHLRLRLIPREQRFFDLFVDDAANVLGAARLLEAMLRAYDVLERRAGEIRDAEHRGDEISHDIGHRLEVTFVTPFDREDIHALISGLDDVLDLIEEVADTFVLYRIESPTKVAIKQASIIVKQCQELHEALVHLRGFKGLEKYWIEIHRLENEGDRVARQAIATLFEDRVDAVTLIKWKEIYNLLEATIDKCEDVANIIERITIKHA
jgi:predicted phosphate transport protein (TIGR00153 family)